MLVAIKFQPGDWVWVHMRKERFPEQRKSKLQPRGYGPFQVLERINDNAYKIDLPGEYNVSATFNVSDLSPFDFDEDADLRTNPFEERGNDRNQESKLMDPLSINEGLVTRARAKRMKEGLNGLIQEIWAKSLTQHGLDGLEGTSRLQNIIQVQDPVQEH